MQAPGAAPVMVLSKFELFCFGLCNDNNALFLFPLFCNIHNSVELL